MTNIEVFNTASPISVQVRYTDLNNITESPCLTLVERVSTYESYETVAVYWAFVHKDPEMCCYIENPLTESVCKTEYFDDEPPKYEELYNDHFAEDLKLDLKNLPF